MDDHLEQRTLPTPARAALDVSLCSATHLDDPYALYTMLREQLPVVWHSELQMWFVARYHDACVILGDRRLGKEHGRVSAAKQKVEDSVPESIRILMDMRDRWFLRRDPPHHTRLKNLIRQALSPEAVAALGWQIQARVDALLDRARGAAYLDIIGDLATPLTISVMTHVLGLPELETDLLLRWSHELMRFAEPDYIRAEWDYGGELTMKLLGQLRELIRDKHHAPLEGSLLAHLLAAQRRGLLDEDELLATCTLLLFAGSGTTTDLIGNCMLALLQHPQHLNQLQHDPSLVRAAVNEAVRYDPPLQMCTRVAMEDLNFGGQHIRAGDWVGVLLGSACRDPGYFTHPEVFSLQRTDGSLLPFGHGQHFCPGMALARSEATHAIGTLLRRMPRLELGASPPRRRGLFVFRGLAELPVIMR